MIGADVPFIFDVELALLSALLGGRVGGGGDGVDVIEFLIEVVLCGGSVGCGFTLILTTLLPPL